MSTKIKSLFVLISLAGLLSSCSSDPQEPGRIFMPDMTYSQAYETYTENPNFQDSMTARLPVEGTISRGTLPEDYKNTSDEETYQISYLYKRYYEDTNDDYERAGRELKNPFEPTEKVLKRAKSVYEVNCQVCHGPKGMGKGTIVENGAYPPVPSYKDRLAKLKEGQMFHSIVYGKNLMGSYSSQVSVDDIWKVIYYIQKLGEVGPFEKKAESEEAKNDTTETTVALN